MSCYSLATPESTFADTPGAAGEAAERLRGPVAIKAVAPTLVHKTDAGAVALGLAGHEAVAAAARDMRESAAAGGHAVEGYLVQRMAPAGVEMLVGVVHDPLFGPVVACGCGGTTAELVGDVAVRLSPVTDRDAHDMVRSLRTYPLLRGYRGATPVDVDALEDVVLRRRDRRGGPEPGDRKRGRGSRRGRARARGAATAESSVARGRGVTRAPGQGLR